VLSFIQLLRHPDSIVAHPRRTPQARWDIFGTPCMVLAYRRPCFPKILKTHFCENPNRALSAVHDIDLSKRHRETYTCCHLFVSVAGLVVCSMDT